MTVSLQQLSSTSTDAPLAPFCLDLQDESVLNIVNIVRKVPNKRLVCKAIWNNQAVYTKIFIGSDAEKYAARDQNGVALLLQAGIETPAQLHVDKLTQQRGVVLLFAEVLDCKNAQLAYAEMAEKARFNLAKLLVVEVAKHHKAGLIQTDLHLKNFLVQGERIFTLDGDGIRKLSLIARQKALENLSVLFSKFDVLALENWLPELLKSYALTRGWLEVPDAILMQSLTRVHRRQVASHYAEKKVFRTCADVTIAAPNSNFLAVASPYVMAELAFTPELWDDLISAVKVPLKKGNSTTVVNFELSGKLMVIKRYNIKGVWHGLSRALRPSRASISWANAHRLKLLGIAAAKPIAMLETQPFGLRGKAYFLAEHIDAPDAAEFFKLTSNKGHRAAAIKNIATLFYKLYLLQISHGDMKATNIKIQNNKPVLIDLDSMCQHSQAGRALKAHVRDLQRFMQNWLEMPSLYNAFVKTFKVIYPDNSMLVKAGIATNKQRIK